MGVYCFQFADPCPSSMRDVKISDLSSVDINWCANKM